MHNYTIVKQIDDSYSLNNRSDRIDIDTERMDASLTNDIHVENGTQDLRKVSLLSTSKGNVFNSEAWTTVGKVKVLCGMITVLFIIIVVAFSMSKDSNISSGNDTVTDDDSYMNGVAYASYCVGNCKDDKEVYKNMDVEWTNPGGVLMGGETDVVQAFVWQIANANGGDFVILRADNDSDYNPWVYQLSIDYGTPLNSVTTICFFDESASNDSTVLSMIRDAEALFFAGGDQSYYIKYWMGTEIQKIFEEKRINITIGGTSAGCAVLGGYIYSDSYHHRSNLMSGEALSDPTGPKLTLTDGPLVGWPALSGIITDTHFIERNRMGRMLAFVAKLIYTYPSKIKDIRGLGVDGYTAVLYNTTTNILSVVGHDDAYLCGSYGISEMVYEQDYPLTFQNVSCIRLAANISSYDLNTNTPIDATISYCVNITAGIISPLHYGEPINDDDLYGYYYNFGYDDNSVHVNSGSCSPFTV